MSAVETRLQTKVVSVASTAARVISLRVRLVSRRESHQPTISTTSAEISMGPQATSASRKFPTMSCILYSISSRKISILSYRDSCDTTCLLADPLLGHRAAETCQELSEPFPGA